MENKNNRIALHEQIHVKVNIVVDKGIKGIVEALSSFPELETIESCEGNSTQSAWVCFRYGKYWEHNWRDLTAFVLDYIAPGLIAVNGDDTNVRIQVTPSGQIFGELYIRPGAIYRVEMTLHQLSRDFSAYQRHNSEYCDDRSDTLQQHY